MRDRPLARLLFPSYFIVMLVSTLVLSYALGDIFKNVYLKTVKSDLRSRTSLLLMSLEEENFKPVGHGGIKGYVRDLGRVARMRITWIDKTGQVIADSNADESEMENHLGRKEVRDALKGKASFSTHYSRTLGTGMIYYAVPAYIKGQIIGTLRSAYPLTRLDYGPTGRSREFILSVIIVALVAAGVSTLTTRGIAGALDSMRTAAVKFSSGDFKTRSPIPNITELAALAETSNKMMDEISRQLKTISQQASERSAILQSMVEGVIALDNNDKIIIMNDAASNILGNVNRNLQGATLQEAIRNPVIQRFVSTLTESSEYATEEFTIRSDISRIVKVVGVVIKSDDGKRLGILIVLNDITEFRKLENIRKDFVANVSHELRTPITSIKGYAEMLLNGADKDESTRREFLGIIERQADRLNAVIEDLLSLSAMEHDENYSNITMISRKMLDIVESAVATCSVEAERNAVRVEIICKDDITAVVNPRLMEQAIFNLVDNAIKYSPNGNVTVKVIENEDNIQISVQDNGRGIEAEHLDRLFERFYRVDKARSRKLGGTGLGLSIVKHIVGIHNGQIVVESKPGEGSTFTIYIPKH